MESTLFNKKTIKRLCSNIKVTSKQKKTANEWIESLENEELKDEKSHYFMFGGHILRDLLGYDVEDKKFLHEERNIEFLFKDRLGKPIVCFEVKGTKTKDLWAKQGRDTKTKETPVNQIWFYMTRHVIPYGILTNYREFVLFDRNKSDLKFHWFDFSDIKHDPEKLKEFIAVFSKESIFENKFIEKLYKESIVEERDFTKQFYKLFHETRLMLIKEFQDNGANGEESIHFAQIFLNRLMFVFFAEDTGKLKQRLFEDMVLNLLKVDSIFSEKSHMVCNLVKSIFENLNEGSKRHNIFGFNGGLFKEQIPEKIYFRDFRKKTYFNEIYQHSTLKKEIELDERTKSIIDIYDESINPITLNLLYMASFDFNTEVSVNILGHIFEQSISDLEELKLEKVLRRKKEGVYYTPDFITDYICRNTIIPYLSKKGVDTVEKLIDEYADNIDDLEDRFIKLKILDPACGSGSFLLKAIEVLLEIHRQIQIVKQIQGQYTAKKVSGLTRKQKRALRDNLQLSFTKWHEEDEAREIIENNIFGVDINEESVEITKLSLFFKIAKKNKKLIDLSKNIKCGNSLIEDSTVDVKAFNWEREFPFKFDIVIGNPPYIRVQNLRHEQIDWYKTHKKTAYRRVDISILFIELAKDILKQNGIVGYITSNQFLTTEYGKKIRKFLLANLKIKEMIDFGDLHVFEDALTYVSIFILENAEKSNFKYLRVKDLHSPNEIDINKGIEIDIKSLDDRSWILASNIEKDLINRLNSFTELGEIGNAWAGLFTGLDKVLMFDKEEIDKFGFENELILPVIRGSDPKKYSYSEPSKYVLYPYKIEEKKTVVLNEDELKNKYPICYDYLIRNKPDLLKRKDSRKTFENRNDWYALTRFGHKDIFNKDKIVTPGEVKGHKFGLDISKSGFSCARVFAVTIDDNSYDLKYILSILNSDLIKFYLRHIAPLKQGGFYTYSSSVLNQIPIMSVPLEQQKQFIGKVDSLLNFNKDFVHKKNRFLKRIKENLNIEKITKKLDTFYELNFNQFVKELSKQKIKFNLKEQDEWEDYFNEYKEELIKLKKHFDEIDKEINQMIYCLYGLANEEINIVEESLKK